jgi:hypothetical protein
MRSIVLLALATTFAGCATGASSGDATAADPAPTSVHGDVFCGWEYYGGVAYGDSDVVFGASVWTVYAGDGRTIYVSPGDCWVEQTEG